MQACKSTRGYALRPQEKLHYSNAAVIEVVHKTTVPGAMAHETLHHTWACVGLRVMQGSLLALGLSTSHIEHLEQRGVQELPHSNHGAINVYSRLQQQHKTSPRSGFELMESCDL